MSLSKFSGTFCWSGTTNGGEELGDEFTITISGEKDCDGEGDGGYGRIGEGE